MTIHPIRQQFDPLISGNVRTADLVNSIAKQVDAIARNHPTNPLRISAEMVALSAKLRRLAETIEKGEK